MVTPLGPHHCFIRSGSVKHFHTRSRGASKTRLMTNSCGLFSSATFFLLGLDFSEVIVETVEAFFPEAAVVLDPFGDVFQRACLQPPRTPPRLAAAGDQPRALQHL